MCAVHKEHVFAAFVEAMRGQSGIFAIHVGRASAGETLAVILEVADKPLMGNGTAVSTSEHPQCWPIF